MAQTPLPDRPSRRRASPSRAWLLVPLLAASAGFAACFDVESEPGGTTTATEPPEAPAVPPQNGAQRLSIAQYRNAVHDLFGQDIAVPTALEPDTSLEGFVSIGSAQSAISPRGVEQYEDAAFKIAAQALDGAERRAALIPCKPAGNADETCARAFVTAVGRKVWRRPLSGDEVTMLAAVITGAGDKLGDFYQGVEFGIAALLQAPSFLYRTTKGEADPGNAGKTRATAYEMASRLSFFLWNSTPDDELLDLAESGTLVEASVIEAQVERMLADTRARGGLRNFVTEYLRLDQLDALSKDAKVFTYYSPDVGPAAREETLLGFERTAFVDDGDFRDLFTTRSTFVNPKLASIYQVLAPDADGFAQVSLPADKPRRGLLGQVSFLALYAHPTSSSATLRGKLVREVLLCSKIPPPPVNVNTALPEPVAGAATLRERVKIHLEDPFCSSCHLQMDPIGLGIENFDGIGRYRLKDNGAVIDASGDLDGEKFADFSELAELVRNHPALPACFARRMYEYATSFATHGDEKQVVAALAAQFEASGYRIRSLMRSVAVSPGFRLVGDSQ